MVSPTWKLSWILQTDNILGEKIWGLFNQMMQWEPRLDSGLKKKKPNKFMNHILGQLGKSVYILDFRNGMVYY